MALNRYSTALLRPGRPHGPAGRCHVPAFACGLGKPGHDRGFRPADAAARCGFVQPARAPDGGRHGPPASRGGLGPRLTGTFGRPVVLEGLACQRTSPPARARTAARPADTAPAPVRDGGRTFVWHVSQSGEPPSGRSRRRQRRTARRLGTGRCTDGGGPAAGGREARCVSAGLSRPGERGGAGATRWGEAPAPCGGTGEKVSGCRRFSSRSRPGRTRRSGRPCSSPPGRTRR